MAQPPKPNNTSSIHPPAYRSCAISREYQKNRRQYALPKSDFEHATHAPQGSHEHGLTKPGHDQQTPAVEQHRPIPVSPYINATGRAHGAQLCLASVDCATPQETFCDITPLLRDCAKREPVEGIADKGDVLEMHLSEDEELGEEFEVIDKRECGVVHNGTVRWYRGFRR